MFSNRVLNYCLTKIRRLNTVHHLVRLDALPSTPGRHMARVLVRCIAGEERIQITLTFPPSGGAIDVKQREFNFDRLKSEDLERTLSRISASVSKIANRKKKKKSTSDDLAEVTPPTDIPVSLFRTLEEIAVDPTQVNEQAWTEGALLQIGSVRYTVRLNAPTIIRVSLPEVSLQKFPVRPRLVTEFADSCRLEFVWYRKKSADQNLEALATEDRDGEVAGTANQNQEVVGTANEFQEKVAMLDMEFSPGKTEGEICSHSQKVPIVNADMEVDGEGKSGVGHREPWSQQNRSGASSKRKIPSGQNSAEDCVTWEEIHRGLSYVPTLDDVSCLLRVDCAVVDSDGERRAMSAVSKFAVTPGPAEPYPFERRHRYTEEPSGVNRFRVVTYNILADLYADSDFSRDFLFPYCPAYALSIDYRKLLIIKELQGYNADVVCLQEVDRKVFDQDLQPCLAEFGLSGLLRLKTGDVAEGAATFFRDAKFRMVASHDLPLHEALTTDPLHADILRRVNKSPELMAKLAERTTCLQVTVLQSTEDSTRYLLVATVHLYFHPRASHVRLVHAAVCIRHIESTLERYATQGIRPAVIFCGDLNSWPRSGLHEFLAARHVPASHADWYAGGKPEFVPDMALFHSLQITSACGAPPYTNYVTGFSECLDYIYSEPARVRAERVVPLPSHEEVTRYTALPSIVFPSDHLALVADFEWVAEGDVDGVRHA